MTYARCHGCKEFKECEPCWFAGWPNIADGEYQLCEKCGAESQAKIEEGMKVVTHETTLEEIGIFLAGLERAAKDFVFRAGFKRRIADPNSKEHAGFMSAITAAVTGHVGQDGKLARLMRKCGLLGPPAAN